MRLRAGVLPKTEPEEKRLFDRLKHAYIDARYPMSYCISSAELATLQAQVLVLAARVREACLDKIATFCGTDAMRKDLPTVPQMGTAVPANLSPLPTDPQESVQWAQSLAELAEQRVQGELRGEARGMPRHCYSSYVLAVLRCRRNWSSTSWPAQLQLFLGHCCSVLRPQPALLVYWPETAQHTNAHRGPSRGRAHRRTCCAKNTQFD